MIIINTVNSTRFSLNGIEYFKNYISEVAGSAITIYNAYDRKDVKVDFVNFAEIELNGTVYGNVGDLQSALLPVIYTRASLGGGGGSDFNLTVYETGETPIDNIDEIEFDGATVTDDGGGKITVTITGGGGVSQDLGQVLDNSDRQINPAFDGETLVYLLAHKFLITCEHLTANTTFIIPVASDFSSGGFQELKILNNSVFTIDLEGDTDVILLGDVLQIPENAIACIKSLDGGEIWSVTYQTNSVSSGGTPTLKEVLDNNHDLVDGIFNAGTGAGEDNTGDNVNALGANAGKNNTGDNQNALGSNAGQDNTGENQNAFGRSAGQDNTGDNVNAFGDRAGDGNTFNNVNLFGEGAQADEDGQTVLSKDGDIMARFSTVELTETRKYTLPDTDGTLALLSDIPPAITIDANPTDGSSNAVSSNGVFDALALKPNLTVSTINFVSCKTLLPVTPIAGAGSGTWVEVYKKLIPANTVADLSEVLFEAIAKKTGSAQVTVLGILAKSGSDDFATAIEIGSSGNWGATSNRLTIRREFVRRSTSIEGITTVFGNPTDEFSSLTANTSNQFSTYAIDFTQDTWVYLAVKGNASDTFQKTLFEMKITPNLS